MSASSRSSFSVTHNAWANVRPEELGGRVTVRHVRGGTSEACWLSLAVGARLATAGVAGECVLTVIEGRVTCHVLGNNLELPTGHFALFPPHIPFALRTAGRSPATVLVHCNSLLAGGIRFETE